MWDLCFDVTGIDEVSAPCYIVRQGAKNCQTKKYHFDPRRLRCGPNLSRRCCGRWTWTSKLLYFACSVYLKRHLFFRAVAYDVQMLYLSLARAMYACLQRAVTNDWHIAWLIYDAVHSVPHVFLHFNLSLSLFFSVIVVCVYVRLSVCLSTTSCDLWRHRSADSTVPTDRIRTHHGGRPGRRSHRPASTASYVHLRAVYCGPATPDDRLRPWHSVAWSRMDDDDETQGRQQQQLQLQQQQGHQTAEHVDAACGHRAVPCDAVIINSTTQTHPRCINRLSSHHCSISNSIQHPRICRSAHNNTRDLLDDFRSFLFISTDICKYLILAKTRRRVWIFPLAVLRKWELIRLYPTQWLQPNKAKSYVWISPWYLPQIAPLQLSYEPATWTHTACIKCWH